MADLIKAISMFSEDAINITIKQCVDVNTKESFISTLKSIQSVLEEPTKKRKKETTLFKMSDKNIFEQRVLPQIREKLAEYDRQEVLGKKLQWKINFDFVENYETLNITDLKVRHAQILNDENTISNLDLVVKLYRGLLYFRARQLSPKNSNMETYFRNELGIGYATAKRYMIFSSIIKRYPRLMVCGLSFNQIMKHQKRLFDSLKADLNLHDTLSQPFSATVENKTVEISPSDIAVPIKTFNVGPDFVYDNSFDDINDDKHEDKEMEDWIQEMTDSNEIFNNEIDDGLDLEEELASKAKIN
jgi:hypothetical protein